MSFDAETIRTYAVQAVTDFVSNGVPLSPGIAKIASTQELNPEQIKRVVEASNTVAHLKLLSNSPDRTFEFPVAKYETVLGHMVQPDSTTNEPTSEAYGSTKGTDEHTKYSMDQSQLETYLAKGVIATKAELEKIAYDKQIVLMKIEASISNLVRSGNPLEKLAEVSDEKTFGVLSPYFGLEKTANVATELNAKLVFTDKELDEARNLTGLVKEAQDLISSEMEKTAFIAKALGGLGRMAGSAIGKPVRSLAKGIGSLAGVTGAVAASKVTKKALPTETAKKWSSIKSKTNTALNLAGSTLTDHANGSVWEQLQR